MSIGNYEFYLYWRQKISRLPQDLNLRGNFPMHFECITLTTRSDSLRWIDRERRITQAWEPWNHFPNQEKICIGTTSQCYLLHATASPPSRKKQKSSTKPIQGRLYEHGIKKYSRGQSGIEPETSRTQSENHTSRPLSPTWSNWESKVNIPNTDKTCGEIMYGEGFLE